MSFPAYPSFPSLRLAVAADLPRMAQLSVLGFKDSEVFRFERPNHEEFPDDSVASFSNLYRFRLLDPRVVVVVAEDWPLSSSYEEERDLPTQNQQQQRVVVGVATWFLPEASPRIGQFVVPDVGDPVTAPDRDALPRRLGLLAGVYMEAQEKYHSAGGLICDKLVVHPAYQRRGHGAALLRWGLQLCEKDGVDQGVIPSHVGESFYLSFGFKVVGELHIPDDGDAKGFSQRVVVYSPPRRDQ